MDIAGSLIWDFFKIKKVNVSGELGSLQLLRKSRA